jgi:hypothetical protein
MKIVNYKCQKCGEERTTTDDSIYYFERICGACRRKLGLASQESMRFRKELERLLEGKELSRNQKVGALLEKAVSDALNELRIPHDHNPFDTTYVCYQGKGPDIIIKKLDTIIECKNLSRKQVQHLTGDWLNRNVVERPDVTSYKNKIVVFSYRPRPRLVKHLKKVHEWRVYSIENQILTQRQAYEAVPRLKQQLCWLSNRLRAREELPYYAIQSRSQTSQ